MLNIKKQKKSMQTIKNLFSYSAVLLGIAACAFLAPSCSDDKPDTPANVSATGIEITPPQTTILAGKTRSIVVTVFPSNATDRTFTLESSNPAIASVANNTITGVSEGDATITATSNDGNFTATCNVTVKAKEEPATINLNSFSQGILIYAGTNYGTQGLSHNFKFQLAGPGYDVVNLTGKGGAIIFEVNTDLSAVTEVPSGKYTMLERDKTEAKTLAPFTAIPGMVDEADGSSPIGTWYLFSESEGGTAEATNDIESGTIDIESTDGTYTIKFDFLDEDDNLRFVGTYSGTLTYFDITQQS